MVVQRIRTNEAYASSLSTGSYSSPSRSSASPTKRSVKREPEDLPVPQPSTPLKRPSANSETLSNFETPKKRQRTSVAGGSSQKTNPRVKQEASDGESSTNVAAESSSKPPPAPKKSRSKASSSAAKSTTPSKRQPKPKRTTKRRSLFKTEVLKHKDFSAGPSDLKAIPVTVLKNRHYAFAPDERRYQVCYLNWLQGMLDKGEGLILPEGSSANEENEAFVLENGDVICKADALERYNSQELTAKQINRLRPCKKIRPEGGPKAIDHWNVCDIDALLEQGKNLKPRCPKLKNTAPPLEQLPVSPVPVYLSVHSGQFDPEYNCVSWSDDEEVYSDDASEIPIYVFGGGGM